MRTLFQLQLTAVLLGLPVTAVADGEGEQPVVDRWMAVYRQRAEALDMRLAGNPGERLDLQPSTLLKYTNPVRNFQQHGAVFLWTRDKRPAVIASIWSTRDKKQPRLRNMAFEWHSLLPGNIVAERDGERLWNSNEPGVEWREFGGTGAPAGSRPLRLLQMRRMARALSPQIATGESELRLMPRPVYRYPERTDGAADGAVFAFVMGTDPELFVLIEARGDRDAAAWHLAFARFSHQPIRVERAGEELWSCEKAEPYQRTGRFYLWWKAERLPAELNADNSTGTTENAEQR